jgi:hypothetical protein
MPYLLYSYSYIDIRSFDRDKQKCSADHPFDIASSYFFSFVECNVSSDSFQLADEHGMGVRCKHCRYICEPCGRYMPGCLIYTLCYALYDQVVIVGLDMYIMYV